MRGQWVAWISWKRQKPGFKSSISKKTILRHKAVANTSLPTKYLMRKKGKSSEEFLLKTQLQPMVGIATDV
jgi:hypothetical protein